MTVSVAIDIVLGLVFIYLLYSLLATVLGEIIAVHVMVWADGKKAGHVALYIGEDATSYHVLGGNQSDSICITRLLKNRLYTSRRPIYKVKAPNIRVISLASNGKISVDEA